MTNRKSTKKALLTSVLCLMLCFSMLVGTTFAWFTDKVESGTNQILAGNLDVEVYNGLDTSATEVDGNTKLFDEIKLWEPGVVAYENLTVANVGNLALKYQLSVIFDKATTNANGDTLAKVLKVGFVEGGIQSTTREGALSEVKAWLPLASFAQNGQLEKQNETDTYGIVIYWEPSDIDNEFNMNNENKGKEMSIELGIQLVATQLMAEEDSFGKDYDANAILPWDGSIGDVPDAVDGVITIYTAEELAAFAASVNNGTSYAGKTVKLGADINLGNRAWTPIGSVNSAAYFRGTFDGQGHTISNLYINDSTNESEHASAGLFGWVDAAGATVKNVNVNGATVLGSHWVGVIAGYWTGTIENCSVTNATVTGYNVNSEANGDKVGGIVGYLNEQSRINNNTVTNSTITGNRDIGGIVGAVAASTREMQNNKVSDTVITYTTEKTYASAGAIVSGRTGYTPNETNVATNVTIGKSVVVTTADELKAALSANADVIDITLANDIAIDIGTGWNMGGVETKSITIRGAASAASRSASNAVVLTLSSTYRSYFNLANPAGTLKLENLVLTNKHSGTHFFDYTTHFNCDLVATNVAFQKAPLTNAVTAVFNNCTFAEPVASYSLWVMAGSDVTVNGGSFNATRGIKIADEDTPAADTTLTVNDAKFTTTAKAAIVVASKQGAKITLSNVDISNVAADTVNAVWVDEDYTDYAGNVSVTGGNVINEANIVDNNDDLIKAIQNGATTVYLASGNYSLRFTNNTSFNVDNMTIIGVGSATLSISSSEVWYGRIQGSNVTFENITFTGNVGATGKATYNNCTINYLECASSGNAETYVNNCTLGQIHTSTDFSAGNAYVKDSTITKAEYSGTATMYFENCTIGELISWNMNTVLTNCTVTTLDDSHMTTNTIVVN